MKHLKKTSTNPVNRPTSEQVEKELERLNYRKRWSTAVKSSIYALITVAAAAVLAATLWLPVLQIYGNSMNPTLKNGEILCSLKTADFKTGDIVAFYYNNKILVKRVIACAGDFVNIDEEGTVYVNDVPLDEPYLNEKAFGDTNIELPFEVPEERIFVMGDNRATSVDSRNTAVGCVSEEQIVGKIIFRVWPIKRFGKP